jgi:hypothetical protein
MADLWQTDPDEYDRRVRVRNRRWAQRDAQRYEEFDADYFEHQESHDLDLIDYVGGRAAVGSRGHRSFIANDRGKTRVARFLPVGPRR